jgi:hypothetical protein
MQSPQKDAMPHHLRFSDLWCRALVSSTLLHLPFFVLRAELVLTILHS